MDATAYAAPFSPDSGSAWLSRDALVFATIFRRESDRTARMQAGVIDPTSTVYPTISVEQAASHPGMDGYDVWAATAIDKYLQHHGMSQKQMTWIASALSRSPMCEVAWAEHYLSRGKMPWDSCKAYDAMGRKYRPHVRPWPKRMGKSNQNYISMLKSLASKAKRSRHAPASGVDPVGLLLADEPWVHCADVWNDRAYQRPVPPADLHGKTIEWDADGLLKRVEHEMLVVGAAFSDELDRKLRQQDGTLSGPVYGGGTMGQQDEASPEYGKGMLIGGIAMGLMGLGVGWMLGSPKTGGLVGAGVGTYMGYRFEEKPLGTKYIGPHNPDTSDEDD